MKPETKREAKDVAGALGIMMMGLLTVLLFVTIVSGPPWV